MQHAGELQFFGEHEALVEAKAFRAGWRRCAVVKAPEAKYGSTSARGGMPERLPVRVIGSRSSCREAAVRQ